MRYVIHLRTADSTPKYARMRIDAWSPARGTAARGGADHRHGRPPSLMTTPSYRVSR
jgi:hypothetical protein